MAQEPMICPGCGNTMNHHADKIDYGVPASASEDELTFGGTVQQIHTCPGCGHTEARAENI